MSATDKCQSGDMVNVKMPDGKYTIVQDATGRTKVLRYNDEWRDVTGDNVILAAAYRIEELETELREANDRIKRMEEALSRVIPLCRHLHHEKKDRHTSLEPCPVEAMVTAAKEAKL